MNPIKNDSVNDFKVVTFKNVSDFDFTPALGAMYDSRLIFGKQGAPTPAGGQGIAPGEELLIPYHVGYRLAVNLAKAMFIKTAPAPKYEGESDKTGFVLFTDEMIKEKVQAILVGEYQEEKPIFETETDKLMRKFAELNKTVESLKAEKEAKAVVAEGYKDKAEVIAALEKRGIKFNARQTKGELEKLLISPEAAPKA